MTKKARCPKCHGRGYIVPRVHGGMVVPKSCDHCNGKGRVDVPMTNADRIRAMSDEELAEFLTGTMCELTHKTATERKLIEYTWLKKLKQPVKEDA